MNEPPCESFPNGPVKRKLRAVISRTEMTNPITAIQKYYDETMVQLRKCTWPSKTELYESTIVVVSSLVLLAAFVMIVDWVSGFAVGYVTSGF